MWSLLNIAIITKTEVTNSFGIISGLKSISKWEVLDRQFEDVLV